MAETYLSVVGRISTGCRIVIYNLTEEYSFDELNNYFWNKKT